MKKKSVFAFMLAMTMMAGATAPSITTQAAGLTQEKNVINVNYGIVGKAETDAITSLFDVDYYKEQNPDVVEAIGDSYDALLKHFLYCGLFEGRTCTADFDPSAYASAYSDVRLACGGNMIMYYLHYATLGKSENRTLTTIADCAKAGITVTSILNENVKISPRVYYVSQYLGTNDYSTVEEAINTAVAESMSSGKPVAVAVSSSKTSNGTGNDDKSITNDDSSGIVVVPTSYSMSEGYKNKIAGMTLADTITTADDNNEYTIYVYGYRKVTKRESDSYSDSNHEGIIEYTFKVNGYSYGVYGGKDSSSLKLLDSAFDYQGKEDTPYGNVINSFPIKVDSAGSDLDKYVKDNIKKELTDKDEYNVVVLEHTYEYGGASPSATDDWRIYGPERTSAIIDEYGKEDDEYNIHVKVTTDDIYIDDAKNAENVEEEAKARVTIDVSNEQDNFVTDWNAIFEPGATYWQNPAWYYSEDENSWSPLPEGPLVTLNGNNLN